MRRAVQSQPWGRWRRLLLRLFVSSFLRSTQELMEVTRMPQLRDARRLQTRREKLEKEALRLAVQEQLVIKEAASSSTPAQGVLTTARDEDRLRPRACVMGSGKYMGPVATLVAAALGLQFPAVHAGAHGSYQDATAQRCPPLTDAAREAGERGPSFGRPRAAGDQRSCIFVNSSPGSFDYSSRRGQGATKGMCDGLGQVLDPMPREEHSLLTPGDITRSEQVWHLPEMLELPTVPEDATDFSDRATLLESDLGLSSGSLLRRQEEGQQSTQDSGSLSRSIIQKQSQEHGLQEQSRTRTCHHHH